MSPGDTSELVDSWHNAFEGRRKKVMNAFGLDEHEFAQYMWTADEAKVKEFGGRKRVRANRSLEAYAQRANEKQRAIL